VSHLTYAWCADLLFGQLNWNTVFADTHQRWEAQKQAWAERRQLIEMQKQRETSMFFSMFLFSEATEEMINDTVTAYSMAANTTSSHVR
jgi:hypothetical protein